MNAAQTWVHLNLLYLSPRWVYVSSITLGTLPAPISCDFSSFQTMLPCLFHPNLLSIPSEVPQKHSTSVWRWCRAVKFKVGFGDPPPGGWWGGFQRLPPKIWIIHINYTVIPPKAEAHWNCIFSDASMGQHCWLPKKYKINRSLCKNGTTSQLVYGHSKVVQNVFKVLTAIFSLRWKSKMESYGPV